MPIASRPIFPARARAAAALTALVLLVPACSSDEQPILETAATSSTALPADPVAEAEAAARRVDTAIRHLNGRYQFELSVWRDGVEMQHVSGLHLATSSTVTRTRDGIVTESVMIDGVAVARQQQGPWAPVETPTDHDPLAPLETTTQIAVTGFDIAITYPGALLGFNVDWVTADLVIGSDDSITITASDTGADATLVLRPASEGLTIDDPTN